MPLGRLLCWDYHGLPTYPTFWSEQAPTVAEVQAILWINSMITTSIFQTKQPETPAFQGHNMIQRANCGPLRSCPHLLHQRGQSFHPWHKEPTGPPPGKLHRKSSKNTFPPEPKKTKFLISQPPYQKKCDNLLTFSILRVCKFFLFPPKPIRKTIKPWSLWGAAARWCSSPWR